MKTLIAMLLAFGLGAIVTLGLNETIQKHSMQVDCVEYIRVGNNGANLECALFEWRGETYATKFAPIYEETK